ncbi:MAG: T9SS type A sorting domain-containing protein [Bacteroidales bacterium]|nr:T9SS type A sorting domain-containing protein [Bacteroidales bacterium]
MRTQIIILSILFCRIMVYSQEPWMKLQIWDSITFETSHPDLILDTSQMNIWQIARPRKIFFDSAYASKKAILTDSLNNYPVGNHSYFDIRITPSNSLYHPSNSYVQFKHKYDTDTLKDGGYITISHDKGETWNNLLNDTDYEYTLDIGQNLYTEFDSLYNGELGFSGKSDGWINTYFGWTVIIKSNSLYPHDTLILRFNFISDSIDNGMEGWMIDHIRLFSIIWDDVNNDEFIGPVEIYPNPVQDKLSLKIGKPYTDVQVEIIDIQGKTMLNNKFSYDRAIRINIQQLPEGVYFAKIIIDNDNLECRKFVINRN